MSKNNLVERQKTANAKRRKTKIVKWQYVTKPFDVIVEPATVKRVHAPLVQSLSPHYTNEFYLHLRPCVQGLDEYGVVIKYLYCTRDGRFFVRAKDGWVERKPADNFIRRGFRSKAGGGNYDFTRMVNFGNKYCHRCVAVAWCNPPKEALAEINDMHIKKKWQVDHLNTDHKNWTADNLQWVTVEENRRRGKIARRMRKIGLDPKRLTRTLLLGIYSLNTYQLDVFFAGFISICNQDPSPLSIDAIRLDVAQALDIMRVSNAVDGSGQLLTTNNPS